MLNVEGIAIIDVIHRGKTNQVLKGIELETNNVVAIKTTNNPRPSAKQCQTFTKEFGMATLLNGVTPSLPSEHSCRKSANESNEFEDAKELIIKQYRCIKVQHRVGIVMEHFGTSNLKESIPKDGYDLDTFFKITFLLIDALELIHKHNFVHRSFHPFNVLIQQPSESEELKIKVIDFAMASRLQQEFQSISSFGTLKVNYLYMAPEQTGRMNRSIDYRSDFYSLGVMLFELLTGTTPFNSNDPHELTHCHIAREPPFAKEIKPNIPEGLCLLISRLLHKNAEDRYQSSRGIANDLHFIKTAWSKGETCPFKPGQFDVSARFLLPEKLYGREKEVEQLLSSVNGMLNGKIRRMFVQVRGYSGIGKTSLVNEVHKVLFKERGICVSSKLDQTLNDNSPYGPFRNAFKQFVDQILTEDEDVLISWRSSLLETLGGNGKVIIDLLPELEVVIGQQPPVAELGPKENEQRFQMMLNKFLSVIATQEHPLVICFDDLQWASESMIGLISQIMFSTLRFVLIIGAYRDNEVGPTHRLTHLINRLEKADKTTAITLHPLKEEDIRALICDSCYQIEHNPDLPELISILYRKTQGNAFFINTCLKTLYKENLFCFDWKLLKWNFDLTAIKNANINDNIVDLFVRKMIQLPQHTIISLSTASLLGNQFDLTLLALVLESTVLEVYNSLNIALEEGFILPLSGDYEGIGEQTEITQPITFRFLHDRIQQAALTLLTEEKRTELHYKTANLLLSKFGPDLDDSKLFLVVGCLNNCVPLLQTTDEKVTASVLNLRAGILSKDSTAYESARNFAIQGMKMVPKELAVVSTNKTYLGLKTLELQTEYFLGRYDKSEQLFKELLPQLDSPFEKIDLYCIMKAQYEIIGRYKEAVQVLIDGLELLDIVLPSDDEETLLKLFKEEMVEINEKLGGRKISDLINAPMASDPKATAALKLLYGLWTPTYVVGKQNMTAYISAKMVVISLMYGHTEYSSIGYCAFALYGGAIMHEYAQAYEFALVGIKLSEQKSNDYLRACCYFIFGAGILVYIRHLKHTRYYMESSCTLAIQSGDFLTAAYACAFLVTDPFFCGEVELSEVKAVFDKCYVYLSKNIDMVNYTLACTVSVKRLMGLKEEKCGNFAFDSDAFLATFQHKQPIFMACYYVGRIMSMFYFLDFTMEDDCFAFALKTIEYTSVFTRGTFKEPLGIFFGSLIIMELYPTLSAERKAKADEVLDKSLYLFEIFVKNGPCNYEHMRLLMEAFRARLKGKTLEAIDFYESALESAREYEYLNIEAIISEQYARFWLSQPKPREKIARIYLQDAVALYRRWGAVGKLDHMQVVYSSYLSNLPKEMEETVSPSFYENENLYFDKYELSNILKATQEISVCTEPNIHKFLKAKLKIVFDYSGAVKMSLFLVEQDKLFVNAELATNQEYQSCHTDFVEWQNGAHSVVNFVNRTKKSLNLGDAIVDSSFSSDPYIVKKMARSILAIPMLGKAAVLKGICYFENNLASQAFTRRCVETLEVFLHQLCISINNITFFNERTRYFEEKGKRGDGDSNGSTPRQSRLVSPTSESDSSMDSSDSEFPIKKRRASQNSDDFIAPSQKFSRFN